jgi:BCD family chlorophyll transporter-like MFS transporter
MGLWGAAQAIAFAGGGVVGTALADLARLVLGAPGLAYALVFALEALLFVASARLAARIALPIVQPSIGAVAPGVMACTSTAEERS